MINPAGIDASVTVVLPLVTPDVRESGLKVMVEAPVPVAAAEIVMLLPLMAVTVAPEGILAPLMGCPMISPAPTVLGTTMVVLPAVVEPAMMAKGFKVRA